MNTHEKLRLIPLLRAFSCLLFWEGLTGVAGYTPKGMTDGLSFNALLPDYSVSGMPEALGYIVSAVLGVAILVIVFKLLGDGKKDDAGVPAQAK